MKTSIDDTLAHLIHTTHSPRGQYAATPQTYQSLLDRIPVEQRPVIGHNECQQRSAFTRWNVAASLLLVVSLGLAITGIWHYQNPPASESRQESASSELKEEPRILVYQTTPLSVITAELSEIYETPIQIVSPELRIYGITATFCTDETLDDILAVLAEIGNFEVRKTTEGYEIEYKAFY